MVNGFKLFSYGIVTIVSISVKQYSFLKYAISLRTFLVRVSECMHLQNINRRLEDNDFNRKVEYGMLISALPFANTITHLTKRVPDYTKDGEHLKVYENVFKSNADVRKSEREFKGRKRDSHTDFLKHPRVAMKTSFENMTFSTFLVKFQIVLYGCKRYYFLTAPVRRK